MSRVLSLLLLATSVQAEVPFEQVHPGRTLHLPRDYGAHYDFETEWWYFTGHLVDGTGKTSGFELTFFRIGVSPAATGAWRVRSLFLAHFALTDDSRGRFTHFERASRGNFGDAGASEETLNVWIRDWRAALDSDELLLEAAESGITLKLRLRVEAPVVLHGDNGYSRKGPGVGEASYYFSLPRLTGDGSLQLADGEPQAVRASVWMDKEFTSSSLARGSLGWDWFALQLDSGEALMLYQLRQADGSVSPFSSGTFIRADGSSEPLGRNDFSVEVLDRWHSRKTQTLYPIRWRLRVPKLRRSYLVTPTVQAQELTTPHTTRITYWEGRSLVTDENGERRGAAYVELVGYQK